MTEFQIALTLSVFGAVILAIAFDIVDMAVAALLGVSVLLAAGILDRQRLMASIDAASGPLLLLAGGMIVAHTLGSTGIFDRISAVYLRATRGSGKRFLTSPDRARRAALRAAAERDDRRACSRRSSSGSQRRSTSTSSAR